MASGDRFENYDQFFAHYVQQHSHPANRVLHAVGTLSGLAILIGAVSMGKPWWALAGFPVAYAFAWTGHFFVEHNKPATFGKPWWSFISDFRMLWLMLRGRLKPWLNRTSS
jgi:hypothetical protein